MIRSIIIAAVLSVAMVQVHAQTKQSFPTPEELAKQIIANSKENKVAQPVAYEPVGPALARLCQSDPFFFFDEWPFFPAWLPPPILKLEPSSAQINRDSAHIEFGGGFHHFGYDLKLDKSAADAAKIHWILTYVDEEAPSKVLMTFALKKNDHVDESTFVNNALAEYERRVAKDEVLERNISDRITFLLKFDQVRMARESIIRCATMNEKDWLDQLFAYVMDANNNPTAGKRLTSWAGKMNDFSAWLLASYAFDFAGDHVSAEHCAKAALAQNVDEPDWVHTNVRHRGTPVCAQLLAARHYATCIALCDALSAFTEDGDYLLPQISAIKNLASRAKQDDLAPTPPKFEEGTVFEPFSGIDLIQLSNPHATTPKMLNPNDRLLDYYRHRVEADGSQRNYATEISFFFSLHRQAEGLSLCQTAAKAFPDWWMPQMAMAVYADDNSRLQVYEQFRTWVEKYPGFIHWWYLSRYDRDHGHNGTAINDLQNAAKYPMEPAEDETWDLYAFAFDAATFAYEQKQFDLVLKITDVWSKPRGPEQYLDYDLYAFRAAAELSLGKFDEAKKDAATLAMAAREPRSFCAGDLDELQQAVRQQNKNFIYQPGNHCCGGWSLFPDQ